MTEYPESPVFIVDDEVYILQSLTSVLRSAGINNVITVNDSRNLLPLIRETEPSVILLDLTMPHISGEELLPRIKSVLPAVPVVIITGVNELSTAVNCMKNGAFDYLVKAIENSKLISVVKTALNVNELSAENRLLKKSMLSASPSINPAFDCIITEDRVMKSIFQYLSLICASKQTVLIRGETGTGKDLLAEAVHRASGFNGEFVGINAAGLDDTMFSDTLFGHRKGAFSGADSNRAGLIEKAADGTLFLDEVGDLPPSSQIKLLRLLEKGEYYRLGSDLLHRSSCRIIAATNCNLEEMIEGGEFRRDLYYRLSAHEVHLPPLEQRRGDIPLLIHHFTERISAELGREVPEISSDFIRAFCSLKLSGNVRELVSVLTRAVSLAGDGVLDAAALPAAAEFSKEPSLPSGELIFPEELPDLKNWANLIVDEAVRRSGGNISAAAALLGISQPALSKRLANRNL